jgi:hypothetical protein
MKWKQGEENCIVRRFIICPLHQILKGYTKEDEKSETPNMKGDVRNSYTISVGMRPLTDTNRRWESNTEK